MQIGAYMVLEKNFKNLPEKSLIFEKRIKSKSIFSAKTLVFAKNTNYLEGKMGCSVFGQVDSNKYFSLSTITREKMALNGLNMTIKQLRELARKRPYFTQILVGQSRENGYMQKVKIWRYEDFKNLKKEEEQECLEF